MTGGYSARWFGVVLAVAVVALAIYGAVYWVGRLVGVWG